MDSVGSGADSEQNDKRLIQAMKSYLDNDFVTAGTVLADVDKTLLDGQEAQDVYDYGGKEGVANFFDSDTAKVHCDCVEGCFA